MVTNYEKRAKSPANVHLFFRFLGQARSSPEKTWCETGFMVCKIPKNRENPQNFKHLALFPSFSWYARYARYA